MSINATSFQPAAGPGSVSGSPHLPDRFTETFRSALVDIGDIRLHAVFGGDGPPLLLVGGWPQTWYAWRMVMPLLALHHSVIVAEPRGIGLSDKPARGYDTGTLAADSVALMHAFGYDHFDMVGHDIGMWTGYALASDHPEVVDRLVLMEALIPGVSQSAPFLGPSATNDKLWHFAFNRLPEINEQLVRSREHLFFSHQFRSKAASPTAIPEHAIEVYVDSLARSDAALRSSFEFYRTLDETIAQNERRLARRLVLPILAIAGESNLGPLVAQMLAPIADNVENVIIPNAGHYPAEENPRAVLEAISTFLGDPTSPH
jgi:pimeloyl-ACP methyl ester carboxylesterase